jgi:hypothetical protein
VKAEVILGDNTTTLKIDEEITLNMSFFSPLSNKKITKTIKMLLINAPGKTIIIGLPDIVDHYYDLFLEMIKAAKNDLTLAYENKKSIKTFDSINLRNNFNEVDLKLPIEGLEEPFVPWKDNPWVISPEELLTPEPCSFTGPLAYLSVSHDEAVKDYHELLKTHISEEFREAAPKLMELMQSDLALEVFVPKTWMGVNAPPLKFETLPGMPTHMKPAARPINKRIYDSAKTEVDRMLTYFYVESDSPIASPLVVAPKATKPFIRICGDYTNVNKWLKMPQIPMPNVKHEIQKCSQFTIYLDLDAANSYHQFKLDLATSLLLSVQTVWGLLRPLYLPEGVSPAQGVLMKFMKEAFSDYEEWMVVLYDNILVCANTMDEAYNKLKLVLQRAHDLNIVLKMSKTWLGFRSVQFFGYKITGPQIELTAERKQAIQDIEFPKSTKMM